MTSLFSHSYYDEQVIPGDLNQIKEHLPKLYVSQVEDVHFIEKRFKNGKGYLCTNNTGTGKTFVGIGVAQRFTLQNKSEILIVCPTDAVCKKWIKDAQIVGLTIVQLKDTNDAGSGVNITTYANYRSNDAILSRVFDLVIYDESHYITQNIKGDTTSALIKHKKVANLPSSAKQMVIDQIGLPPRGPSPFNPMNAEEQATYRAKVEQYQERLYTLTKQRVDRTKVLFLSATPFAYRESTIYADGVLWDIYEQLEKPSFSAEKETLYTFNDFLIDHFQYTERWGKLYEPDVNVDINKLERNFFEKWREKGVMSNRMLDLPYDYSRHFINVPSNIGQKIDEYMAVFFSEEFEKKYPIICQHINNHWKWVFINQLLESIKAMTIHSRIKDHMDLGRKVIVFHSYNNLRITHPFHFTVDTLITLRKWDYQRNRLQKEIDEYRKEYAYMLKLDLKGLENPRDTIKKHFPHALYYNGTVNKKKRTQYIKMFNEDNLEHNLIVVQTKSGREGISLHDLNGKFQRVVIQLGLPTAPTEAIQCEGRIYRSGLESNAIYEYICINTGFEMKAFADKISKRAKTAENLAMGNKARDLENAFLTGYSLSNNNIPDVYQGFGGKTDDKFIESKNEFDRAVINYEMFLNKFNFHKERFTPDPLAYKMVDWLNDGDNRFKNWLEPCAGIGSIARYFPKRTNNTFIEKNYLYATRIGLFAEGNIKIKSFGLHNRRNKYQRIIMVPPFNEKVAVSFLSKAFFHMYKFSDTKLLAVMPNSQTVNNFVNKALLEEANKLIYLTCRVKLNKCVYGIETQMLLFEIKRPNVALSTMREVDWRVYNNLSELFNHIKNVDKL